MRLDDYIREAISSGRGSSKEMELSGYSMKELLNELNGLGAQRARDFSFNPSKYYTVYAAGLLGDSEDDGHGVIVKWFLNNTEMVCRITYDSNGRLEDAWIHRDGKRVKELNGKDSKDVIDYMLKCIA